MGLVQWHIPVWSRGGVNVNKEDLKWKRMEILWGVGKKKRCKRVAAFWQGMFFVVQQTQCHLQSAWLKGKKQNNLSESVWKESENSSRCGSFFSLQFKHTTACLFPQCRADLQIFHELLLTAAQLVAAFQPSASMFKTPGCRQFSLATAPLGIALKRTVQSSRTPC